MKRSSRKILNYLIAFVASLCCVCIVSAIGVISSGSTISTPTPALRLPQLDISTIIAQTSSAAQTQTLIAAPLTSTQFIYDTPTMLPSIILVPTWTLPPTQTPFILATLQLPPDASSQCICTEDVYNCGDPLDKICFNYCNAQGYGDVHRLDGNNNGIACDNP